MNPVENKNIYRSMLAHPQYGARVFIDQRVQLKDRYPERI